MKMSLLAVVTSVVALSASAREWTVFPERHVPVLDGVELQHEALSPGGQLIYAFTNAQQNDVIQLEDGTYSFAADEYMSVSEATSASAGVTCTNRLVASVKNLTLRGETATSRRSWTSRAEPVIIDGGKMRILEIPAEASGFKVENITFANADGGDCPSTYLGPCLGGAIHDAKHYSSFTNCVFRDNIAMGGGASNGGDFYDCLFSANTGRKRASAVINGYSMVGCEFVENVSETVYGTVYGTAVSCERCIFRGNKGKDAAVGQGVSFSHCIFEENVSTGGTGGLTGGIFTDCHFTNNVGGTSGGVLSGGEIICSNCTFYGNSTPKWGGAILNAKRLVGCRFESNSAGKDGYGGAVCYDMYSNQNTNLIEDCTFVRNSQSGNYGGGAICIYREYAGKNGKGMADDFLTVTGSTFDSNEAATTGGVIYNGVSSAPEGADVRKYAFFTNCTFIGNSGRDCGGIYQATAVDSKFFGNRKSNEYDYRFGDDASLSRLVNCECTGGELNACSVVNCTIHGVTRACVFKGACHVTNCLVVGCAPSNGIYYNRTAVINDGCDLVNCTVVSNNCWTLKNATNLTVVNCAFYASTNSTLSKAVDISFDDKNNTGMRYSANPSVSFFNCYYGSLASNIKDATGANALNGSGNEPESNPKFVAEKGKDIGVPYWALKASSPLRGKGLLLNYGPGDVDLAGNPRIRDDKVDIGCYQCWTPAPGLLLLFR